MDDALCKKDIDEPLKRFVQCHRSSCRIHGHILRDDIQATTDMYINRTLKRYSRIVIFACFLLWLYRPSGLAHNSHDVLCAEDNGHMEFALLSLVVEGTYIDDIPSTAKAYPLHHFITQIFEFASILTLILQHAISYLSHCYPRPGGRHLSWSVFTASEEHRHARRLRSQN